MVGPSLAGVFDESPPWELQHVGDISSDVPYMLKFLYHVGHRKLRAMK